MIDDFLRPAEGGAQIAADALRIFGVLSVAVALLFHGVTDAAIVAFALPGLMVPRFLGMKAWADIAVSVTLLVAAWSNVYDLYTSIWWWDIVVHFVLAGELALVAYLFLARFAIVPQPTAQGFTTAGAVLLTAVLGLALGALWEMVEWFGYVVITDDIHVTYHDTIGDMAAGGLGALCSGWVLARRSELLIPTELADMESSDSLSSR